MSNPTTTGPVCIHCGQPVYTSPDLWAEGDPIHVPEYPGSKGYYSCTGPFGTIFAELWPAPTGEPHPAC